MTQGSDSSRCKAVEICSARRYQVGDKLISQTWGHSIEIMDIGSRFVKVRRSSTSSKTAVVDRVLTFPNDVSRVDA